jgi:hypothetical protein
MIEHRRFRVVLVSNGHGAGAEITASANAEIDYAGKEIARTIQ